MRHVIANACFHARLNFKDMLYNTYLGFKNFFQTCITRHDSKYFPILILQLPVFNLIVYFTQVKALAVSLKNKNMLQ